MLLMSKDEGHVSDREPFEVSYPHLKEFSEFLPELNKESDRGCVMVACSFLDELLRKILLAFFVDVDTSGKLVEGFNAPLGTISTRAAAAYALALISEQEFVEIETLRRVRNRFAHAVHISFDAQDIGDLCRNLTFSARGSERERQSSRGLYTTSAAALILHLTNRPVYVAQRRLKVTKWPY